jgi:hypothetical protein
MANIFLTKNAVVSVIQVPEMKPSSVTTAVISFVVLQQLAVISVTCDGSSSSSLASLPMQLAMALQGWWRCRRHHAVDLLI